MKELIEKAVEGDKEAYTELLQSMENELYRFARVRLENAEDINDAIQETMVKSYYNLKALKKPQYFKTWIKKILINECNKIYREKNSEWNILNRYMEKRGRMEEDYSLENAEDEIDFKNLLDKLKPKDRLIIVLYFKERYTVSEIADVLEMNVETVKTRLKRARIKMKRIVKEE